MNNNEPKTPAAGRRTKAVKAARIPRRAGLGTGLALILASVAALAAGYLWYLLLFERSALLKTDVVGNVAHLEDQNRELRETVVSLEGDLTELRQTQDALKTAVEKIQNDFTRNRTDWVLTEAEQLMVIANNRLHLARDVTSALAALRAADSELNLVSSPSLLPVRRELAREIAQLEAIEKTDVPGIALKLSSLADSVDRLPLALEVKSPPAPVPETAKPAPAQKAGGWRTSLQDLWQDLRSLVHIRRSLEVEKPLLPPEQQYFLRENLRLMLYGAQLGLLQGQIAVYRQDLKTASRWVHEYFDVNTQVVLAMQNDLAKLQSARVTGELPDISASLETLRRIVGRRTGP